MPTDAGDRQPQGGGGASRLVRSGAQAQGAVLLPALRHGDPADQALHAAAQGEGRARASTTCKNNALERAHVRQPGGAEPAPGATGKRTVADTRIHGTTKQQVGKLFAEVERAALLPLPPERFPCFHEAQRKVNRDGHVEVAKAYYSAPPEYLGRTVWVRWDARLVRIFNHAGSRSRCTCGTSRAASARRASTCVREKISGLERGAA